MREAGGVVGSGTSSGKEGVVPCPRRFGATFSPNGTLVVFSSTQMALRVRMGDGGRIGSSSLGPVAKRDGRNLKQVIHRCRDNARRRRALGVGVGVGYTLLVKSNKVSFMSWGESHGGLWSERSCPARLFQSRWPDRLGTDESAETANHPTNVSEGHGLASSCVPVAAAVIIKQRNRADLVVSAPLSFSGDKHVPPYLRGPNRLLGEGRSGQQ